jgi:hypothetical protein
MHILLLFCFDVYDNSRTHMNEPNGTMNYVKYLKLLIQDDTLHHAKNFQFILYR